MSNDYGFIRLSRKFFSNKMWNEARTFSSCEAWLDLIQSARFEAAPRKVSIGGREVVYNRGQYPASQRFLSKRWGWTDRRVRTFLEHLKEEGMITIECTQGLSVITLCNYQQYNTSLSDSDAPNGTTIDAVNNLSINDINNIVTQQVTQILTQQAKNRRAGDANTKNGEENNKENSPYGESKKEKENTIQQRNIFVPPKIEEVEEYIREKGYDIDAEMFVNFYESKGWMIGKNKMKSWRAAVVTWYKKQKEDSHYATDNKQRSDRRGGFEITDTERKVYHGTL